jgi:branched-chain amino acid transport system ATP-binding protein
MLVIGRGLIARPRLLLLDEPSLGLSPMLVGEIFTIIKRLNTEHNITILLVEQNPRMALSIADHGYLAENSRIVLHEPVDRLREDEDVKMFISV